ncbi:flagellar basal body rod protein FlgC [Puniceibacterium sp. IMCC21224]|uniref:flagellar basal body rod protein FlgC n=1 Tax=Puniceibacterium sp. IMCC21224 TaxID=1618204 RepID=UPI00064D7350|nr:flagellar basal body rod protein FlgC [Puniceibacterium sp. IMCC21224]KMK65558.1 flagellar basal-body rod protein FlgC [Puniceibacterium sp. IMCC21224]
MSDFNDSLSVSSSGLRAQSMRLRILSENIANTDTPGYRRKTIPFELDRSANDDVQTISTGRVNLDQSELTEIFDPSHPMANADGVYEGSNVNVIIEIADSREAQRSYEANLKMFDQARQMSTSLMELLRR